MADLVDHDHTTQQSIDHHDLNEEENHQDLDGATSPSKSIITFRLHPASVELRLFMAPPDLVLSAYYLPIVGPAVEIDEQELISESDQAYSKFYELLSPVLISSSYRARLVRRWISRARAMILSARDKEPVKQLPEIACGLRLCNVLWVELRTEGVGMVPASKSAIEALEEGTLRDFVKEDTTSDKFSCSICLEELEAESLVTRMPCNHVFHSKCITQWLNTSHYCPLCRFKLP